MLEYKPDKLDEILSQFPVIKAPFELDTRVKSAISRLKYKKRKRIIEFLIAPALTFTVFFSIYLMKYKSSNYYNALYFNPITTNIEDGAIYAGEIPLYVKIDDKESYDVQIYLDNDLIVDTSNVASILVPISTAEGMHNISIYTYNPLTGSEDRISRYLYSF